MKVLITGAHFTPAAAVIAELKKYPDVEIVYVGRKTTMEGDSAKSAESQILPGMGVKFLPIVTGRLQRSFTIYTIPSLLKIPIGFLMALFFIIKEQPDVILSFGGYVAVPTVLAGWLFSIPILVHEQTLVSGLANKISAFFADKIALSFPGENHFDKKKVFFSGNPIRKEILEWKQTPRKNKVPVILITGGNQGSHAINLAVEEGLKELTKIASVIHVTGDSKFQDFERLEKLGNFNDRYQVKKWIGKEWGDVLGQVDLVVSRAGINTLTELAYTGKPALVIPIGYLYGDEQNKNARYFKELGLVEILPQSKLSGSSLTDKIKQILGQLPQITKQAKLAKKSIIPDAAKRLALETVILAGG